jgi:antitoxin component of MazEF toxin-antitoxin module
MIEIKAKLRKWGNSFGIVVPQKAIEFSDIKEGEEVTILMKKEREENVLKETFGALSGWKLNTQKIKDELRREEFENEKRKWKNLNITS